MLGAQRAVEVYALSLDALARYLRLTARAAYRLQSVEELLGDDVLAETALRLYFDAWDRLRVILNDWDSRIPDAPFAKPIPDMWKEEADAYLEDCQTDLQAIIAVIQQSNELALKARLCAVSPYLLLLENPIPLSADPKPLDFFDLRTIDAQRLRQAVNTLCPKPLPPTFITRYDRLRKIRNRYTHLGQIGAPLNPVEMLVGLMDQFVELWPDRAWLSDRLRVAYHDREAGFGDKFWNPAYRVLRMWEGDMEFMPPARFRALFGIDPNVIRYLCHACRKDAATREGLYGLDAPTAFSIEDGTAIQCLACQKPTVIARERCGRPTCTSDIMGAGDHDGMCHLCGHERGSPADIGEPGDNDGFSLLPTLNQSGPRDRSLSG